MHRCFLHVDINSYFAIMLQQERPSLRGKPIGVIKGKGRSVVIAASKEAKLFGVKTGSSGREARELCPQIQFVPAEFDFYLSATKKLKRLFHTISPDLHIFSLDEAFIDITYLAHLYPDAHACGRMIQGRVKEELGEWVTCNVGISYTKLLAKMAGETSPKGSVFEIDLQNRDEMLQKVGFDDVCGVGRGLGKKLNSISVYTPYAIRAVSDEQLHSLVGPFWAKDLRRVSYGEDSATLRGLDEGHQPFRNQMKSVSRSVTGYHLCNDEHQIRSILYNLTEEISFKARRMGLVGRQVSVWFRGGRKGVDHQSWGGHRTLKRHINQTDEVFSILYHDIYKKWQRSFPIIQFGVRLSMLMPAGQGTLSLFPEDSRRENVTKAVDALAEKYGLFTVRSGVLIDTPVLRPEVTGYFGDKKYYLDEGFE